MGNSSTKSSNKIKCHLSIRNFAIRQLPQKPSQWIQRIDERVWNEFITCCRNAGTLSDAAERKAEYKKWQCNFWIGMAMLMLGIIAAIALGVPGGVTGNTAMWVFAIILGVSGFVGGLILFFLSANKYGEIAKTFISDVKSNLSVNLMPLNNKYNAMIRFNVGGTGNNIFKDKENADTTINISISIELLAQTVQYIPDQQHVMIQQQPSQPVQIQHVQPAQGQVVMVQMPDGRMVPAQIQGAVGGAPQQIQYQQQPQQVQQVVVIPQPQPSAYNINNNQPSAPQQVYIPGGGQIEQQQIARSYHHDVPAYNPEANGIEEQNEGEGGNKNGNPTNGAFAYQ